MSEVDPLREALAAHAPQIDYTGKSWQGDDAFIGCSCGWTPFTPRGRDTGESWADHFAALASLAAPRPEGLNVERLARAMARAAEVGPPAHVNPDDAEDHWPSYVMEAEEVAREYGAVWTHPIIEAIEALPKYYAEDDSGGEEAWIEWADLRAVLRNPRVTGD